MATVSAILEATARILIREGYAKTTTNKIAQAAGVSIGSLYQYFPSKDALIGELIERQAREDIDIMSRRLEELASLPTDTMLRELISSSVRRIREGRAIRKVLLEQIPRTGRFQKMQDVYGTYQRLLREDLVRRGVDFTGRDMNLVVFVAVMSFLGSYQTALFHRTELFEHSALEGELARLVTGYIMGAA